jgi:hypothetical protein
MGILLFFAYLGITATCVVAIKFLDGALWRGSAWWALAAGTTVLLGGVMLAVARRRAHGSDEDPITSPFDDVGSSAHGEARGLSRRIPDPPLLGSLVDTAMMPAVTVVLLAITLVLH